MISTEDQILESDILQAAENAAYKYAQGLKLSQKSFAQALLDLVSKNRQGFTFAHGVKLIEDYHLPEDGTLLNIARVVWGDM